MELLAPAGSIDSLIAAVQSGADAVYIGGSRFSARGSAQNFDTEQMREWVDYCHIRGVAVHVAANTVIKEKESEAYIEYIGELNDIGVDAVIIQDIGMAKAVHMKYPELTLHASTQMTCASLNTALYLESIGFSRIVLARELDIETIEKISKNIKAETEVFVHGAICMSYSGQCLMSSMIGGRSGNRGYCAQPCRLPYKLQKNGKNMKTGYILSPKDMCLANHLEKLRQAGVTSLKIEGRLKRPEYVSTVTGVYRRILDRMSAPTEDEYKQLYDAFNRSGFTDGYFTKKTGKQMMSYENPSNTAENKFTEEAKRRCSKDIELKKIPVRLSAKMENGMPLELTMTDGKNSVTVLSEKAAESAQFKAMTKERLCEQLSKLGNTPYSVSDIQIDIAEGITIPISEINLVRRKACEELSEKRAKHHKNKTAELNINIINKTVNETSFTVNVRTEEQARACYDLGLKTIYAPFNVIEACKDLDADWIQVLSPVDREGKNSYKKVCDKIQISSMGQMKEIKADSFYGEFRLNITNSYSLENVKGFSAVTLSPELTLKEIRAMKKPVDCEIIAYGRIPLMVYENCPKKALGLCNGKDLCQLKDRMNEEFPLICREGCYCELINSKPVYMADKIKDLINIGVRYLRLDFTVEGYKETKKIIEEYKNAMYNGIYNIRKENTFTRGHFYKEID